MRKIRNGEMRRNETVGGTMAIVFLIANISSSIIQPVRSLNNPPLGKCGGLSGLHAQASVNMMAETFTLKDIGMFL